MSSHDDARADPLAVPSDRMRRASSGGPPEDAAGSEEAPTLVTPAPGASERGGEATGSDSTRPSAPPSVAARGGIAGAPLATPLATLHAEEILRSRVFLQIAIPMAVAVLASGFLVAHDPVAVGVVAVGMFVIIVGCAWFAWHLRTDEGYVPWRIGVTAACCIVGAFSGIYFFGAFSPAPVVIPFGLFFFGMAQSFRATLATYLACALAYAGLTLGTTAGLLVDRGVIDGSSLAVRDKLIIAGLSEVIFFATYLIARASRRASLDAVERHDHAVRRLAQREALLREARHELDQAIQVGGVGRFTEVTLGSYRLGRLLGRGAMGEVYEAVDEETREPAAVKVLLPHVLGHADNVRRFLREARLVISIDTPHVARVLEVGGIDAETPYIAMERLHGEDLAEHLRDRRRLGPKQTRKLLREVGAGLRAAWAARIVHRDIKPRNLFLAREGERKIWKVLDFGVSKAASSEGTLTGEGLVGTPAYMAPEQARGETVDHRTDLFALGLIAYRVITGQPAFAGDSVADLIFQVLYTMPGRPSDALPTLEPDVDLALALAIAKDPAERFQSAEELTDAVDQALRGELDPELRERAEALLREWPWGSEAQS